MKFIPPFPKGHINPILKAKGFQESDILEIRKILTDEIRRQNEEEDNQQEKSLSNES